MSQEAPTMVDEVSLSGDAAEPAAVVLPCIDRVVRGREQFALAASSSFTRAWSDARTRADAGAHAIVDEYYKGVKYSPDGLCMLTCVESGAETQLRQRRPPRKKARRTDQPQAASAPEEKKGGMSDTSSSSSSSSSDSSSSSESDGDDAATPQDPADRRGLSMFELPPLRWNHEPGHVPADAQAVSSSALAPSYVYDVAVPPVAADPAAVERHLSPILRCHPGDSIYDFLWNPSMHSSTPASCFFLSTSRCNPIHAWDAFTGSLRASWSGIDQMDELEAAISLCMAPAALAGGESAKIYAGYNKCIRIFDVERPGRECIRLPTWRKQAKTARGRRRGRSSSSSNLSQSGIISCMAVNPAHATLLAAGSYNGEIGLYDLNASEGGGGTSGLDHKMFLDSHGVSQLEFSVDGLYMFASVRRGPHIRVYDMRQATEPVSLLPRANRTNQRMYFDTDKQCGGRFLACGDSDGQLLIFDLTAPPDATSGEISPMLVQPIAGDALCGVSLHPHFSSTVPLVATCSGERQFFTASELEPGEESDADSSSHKRKAIDEPPATATASTNAALPVNSLAVWQLQHTLVLPATDPPCHAPPEPQPTPAA